MSSPEQQQRRHTDPDSSPHDVLTQTMQQTTTYHETNIIDRDSEAETSIAPSNRSTMPPSFSPSPQAVGRDAVNDTHASLSITQAIETSVEYRVPRESANGSLKRRRESVDEGLNEAPESKRQRLEHTPSSPQNSLETYHDSTRMRYEDEETAPKYQEDDYVPSSPQGDMQSSHTSTGMEIESSTISSHVETSETSNIGHNPDDIGARSAIPIDDWVPTSPSYGNFSPTIQPEIKPSSSETEGAMAVANNDTSQITPVPNRTDVPEDAPAQQQPYITPPKSTSSSAALNQTRNAKSGSADDVPETSTSSEIKDKDKNDKANHEPSDLPRNKKRKARDLLSPLPTNKVQKNKSKPKPKPKAKGARKPAGTGPSHRPTTRSVSFAHPGVVHMSLNYYHMDYINVSRVRGPVRIQEAKEYIKE